MTILDNSSLLAGREFLSVTEGELSTVPFTIASPPCLQGSYDTVYLFNCLIRITVLRP